MKVAQLDAQTRKLDSWIEEALMEESEADQSQVITRSMKRPSEGAEPIKPETLSPPRRSSRPSDFAELSGTLEGDPIELVRRGF